MKVKTIISSIFLIFLVSVLIPTASAEEVSIDLSDLDLTKNIEIVIYNHTGHRVGELNVDKENKSSITLDTANSTGYQFVVKPTESSIFSDPLLAIEILKKTIPLYLNYILYLVVFLAGGYLVTRVFR